MMRSLTLAREELRIFEGLVSRFDSLSKARVKCGGSEGTRTRDLLRDRQCKVLCSRLDLNGRSRVAHGSCSLGRVFPSSIRKGDDQK